MPKLRLIFLCVFLASFFLQRELLEKISREQICSYSDSADATAASVGSAILNSCEQMTSDCDWSRKAQARLQLAAVRISDHIRCTQDNMIEFPSLQQAPENRER